MRLYDDYFVDIYTLIPTIQEQQQISNYLDHKTQQIDSLIEKTQQKIELLKEQRTSLINQVVTKGLNPDVEMKDSGVEWIGEIPSGWDVYPMKYGLTMITGKEQPQKENIKISPENVESDTGVCLNLYSDYSGEGVPFTKGDILLNKLRLYLKKILFTEYNGFSMGEMIVLRTKDNLFNKYLFYILFNQGLIDLLDSQSNGVKLPRVSPEVILNTNFLYPPIQEQQQIVEHLDKGTTKIDSTIGKETQRIDLLKEYRQSLISEVVTGKVDVRDEVVV
jgi:type I restriction enzyme, S subunit